MNLNTQAIEALRAALNNRPKIITLKEIRSFECCQDLANDATMPKEAISKWCPVHEHPKVIQ